MNQELERHIGEDTEVCLVGAQKNHRQITEKGDREDPQVACSAGKGTGTTLREEETACTFQGGPRQLQRFAGGRERPVSH